MDKARVKKVRPTCPECGGEEEVPCYECRGSNEWVCWCEGNGCYECHYRGMKDCEDCDPYGNTVCRTCDPDGDEEYLYDKDGNEIWIEIEETEKNETPVITEGQI